MTGNKKKFYNYHLKQNDISEDPWNDGRFCFVIFLLSVIKVIPEMMMMMTTMITIKC